MTALVIIPNYDKKRLKLVGKVAAGEHVAVTVVGGADWIGEGKFLRLRAIFGNKTVAKFPYWTEENEDDWPESVTEADAWTEDGDDATCEFVLNTVPAEKMLRFGGTCLLILDDIETHTLYGASEMSVEPWPKHCGSDTPYSLDEYPDFVKEAKIAITDFAVELQALDAAHSAHVEDAVHHITAAERALWNGKANQTDLNAEAAAREAADETEARDRAAADSALQTNKADKSAVYTKGETDAAIEDAIADLVNGAPEALDTLKEVADWIADDQSGAAAMAAGIASLQSGKVDKVSGKGLSTEDFTSAEKAKLAGIAEGANAYALPAATTSSLGGIKVGANLTVAADGTLSAQAGGSSITVDDEMSGTSENPVQNKVVMEYVGNQVTSAASELQLAIDAKYALPSGGMPKTDLANAVQTSLGKADTALQAHQELRYGFVTKGFQPALPSDAFPVAYTIESTAYSRSDMSALEFIARNDGTPGFVLSDTEELIPICLFLSDGTIDTNIKSCTFGGESSTELEFRCVLDDRAVNTIVPASGASFTIAMGALPSGVTGKARDAVLVIDCTSLTDGQEPTVTWDSAFDIFEGGSSSGIAPLAGKANLYRMTEYAAGHFVVRTMDNALLDGVESALAAINGTAQTSQSGNGGSGT